MILKLKRTPGIYLVGFMGSGKTTIGRLLADRLGWEFVDLDDLIEIQEGMSIPTIFDTRGEPEFRRLEAGAIRARVRDVECGHPTVIALGGGAFVDPDNYDLLQEHGVTIWLDCPFEIVRRRVELATHRPLARDAEKFRALFTSREQAYKRADYRIPIENDDPEQAVTAILRLPLFR